MSYVSWVVAFLTLLLLILVLCSASLAADSVSTITASQNADGTYTVLISKETMDNCIANGGCWFLSERVVTEAMRIYVQRMCGKDL